MREGAPMKMTGGELAMTGGAGGGREEDARPTMGPLTLSVCVTDEEGLAFIEAADLGGYANPAEWALAVLKERASEVIARDLGETWARLIRAQVEAAREMK